VVDVGEPARVLKVERNLLLLFINPLLRRPRLFRHKLGQPLGAVLLHAFVQEL